VAAAVVEEGGCCCGTVVATLRCASWCCFIARAIMFFSTLTWDWITALSGAPALRIYVESLSDIAVPPPRRQQGFRRLCHGLAISGGQE
jgi:hypothetical protein